MKPGRFPCLLGCFLMAAASLGSNVVPRMTFQRGEAPELHREGILNYDTFLLSADGATLYVGGRDAILALNISSAPIRLKGKIPWSPSPEKRRECVFKKKSNETECFNFIRILVQLNETHLYTCGTYAFSPTCAYIDARILPNSFPDPLPYIGGELYTGTMNNFQGNEPVISRTLGSRTVLKTDSFLSWLHDDAVFVASFNVPGPPEEEKIYFFFEETAKEFDFFEKVTVSRVAQVCKNDVGGDKVLQKKWTTFLKAQLSCSQAGLFPHTVLQHVFALPQPGGGSLFYGVFASQWQTGSSGSSAICAFSLDAIKKAFAGKYKELNKDCSRWMTYSGPTMDPRPGSCSVGPSSDKALTFMKDHFLMDEKVAPIHNQPLLVKEDVKYTRIAGILYVGYSEGILEVLVANCSVYATCASCLLARDPYCAWNGRLCQAVWEDPRNRTEWLQDVEQGKAEAVCQRHSGKGRAMPRSRNDSDGVSLKVLTGPFNSLVRLPCPQVSALANYSWTYPEGSLPSQEGLTLRDHTGLLVFVHSRTLGEYACWASENGYRHRVAWYDVRSDLPVDGASSGKGSLEHQAVPVGEWRSYWVQFVTVTVLLSMTLAVAMALGFFSYHDKLKAKTKVQGCSVPESNRAPVQEKAPLNGSQSPPGDRGYQSQDAADGTKSCCVQVEGGSRAVDTDNNRLNCPLMNGEDSRTVEAI
ncbi:hypothetical protein E2320_013700 [Naja naja]|nr:hypothetical protein E2320_013700 [Naja naja]